MPTSKNELTEITTRFINNSNRCIFLTGKAGTGKTTFLKNVSRRTHKNAVVAAPTGIAAINAGGVTLHSLFQLPFGAFVPQNIPFSESLDFQLNTPDSLMKSFKMNKTKRNMLRELELLIIDEVSMLRADLLDAIDVILRSVRRQGYIPFGGLQILFIGDLMQLPPVVKEKERAFLSKYYPDSFFFNAKALADNPPVYIELDKIYRQSDQTFISLLNHLRENRLTQKDLALLNEHHQPGFKPQNGDGFVFLTTHNKKADVINKEALKKLAGESHFFCAEVAGDFDERLYPLDFKLELKKGAQVMFIKNDYSGEKRYFNGKIGNISKLDGQEIVVSFNDDTPPTSVDPYVWENKKYSLNKQTNEIEEKIVGTFEHYPLKPAWAITVHKSQGLTFEKAVIDVSKAFAPGQIYVALSRLTSLEGLVLSAPLPVRLPRWHQSLSEWSAAKKDLAALENDLVGAARGYIIDSMKKAFDFGGLVRALEAHVAGYNKDSKRSVKQAHKVWAVKLVNDTQPLKTVGAKFINQLESITSITGTDYRPKLHERLLAAKGYFDPLISQLSKTVDQQAQKIAGQKRTKTYLNELIDLKRLFFRQLRLIHKAQAMVWADLNHTEMPLEIMQESELFKNRQSKATGPVSYTGNRAGGESKNKKKISATAFDTKTISLEMFRSGQNVAQIAKARELVPNTIQRHLAHFISEGILDIHALLNKAQLKEIVDKARQLETTHLGPIHKGLKKKYSYGQLQMAMAHHQRPADKDKPPGK